MQFQRILLRWLCLQCFRLLIFSSFCSRSHAFCIGICSDVQFPGFALNSDALLSLRRVEMF